MIAPLAKFIDWSAIQIVWGRRLGNLMKWRNNAADSRLEAAIQFLKGPDFVPAESQPARLEFTSGGDHSQPRVRRELERQRSKFQIYRKEKVNCLPTKIVARILLATSSHGR